MNLIEAGHDLVMNVMSILDSSHMKIPMGYRN